MPPEPHPRPPADEARALLLAVDALAGLAPEAVDQVVDQLRWSSVAVGETLYREGDEADGVGFLASGRLRAIRGDGAAAQVLGEVGAGEVVGEMALLGSDRRTATVVAVRDSVVAQLPADAVARLFDEARHPAVGLMRVAAERLLDERSNRLQPPVRVVAVVPLTAEGADLGPALADALGSAALHGPADLAVDHLAEVVDRHEHAGEAVVLVGDPTEPAWSAAASRQADAVLIVADPRTSRRQLDDSPVALGLAGRTSRPRTLLVVCHRAAGPRLPVPPLLDHDLVDEHLHLCPSGPASVERIARRLGARSVGLALAGGGARAFAHLGVHRALREAGLVADVVAGSSVGAALAVLVAQDHDPDELAQRCVEAWGRAKIQLRVSLPTIALTSGPALRRLFEGLYGDLLLEELPRPCLVTTVDLGEGSLVLHDRGPAALWVRASASPPGLSPPVVGDDGSLHIDGAVGDNLPVAGLAAWGADRIIAVNVSPTDDAATTSALTAEPGPVRFVADSVGGRATGYPNVVSTLLRSTMAASRVRLGSALDRADLVIAPDVKGLTMAAYGRAAEAIEPGYQAARRALAEIDLDDWR